MIISVCMVTLLDVQSNASIYQTLRDYNYRGQLSASGFGPTNPTTVTKGSDWPTKKMILCKIDD